MKTQLLMTGILGTFVATTNVALSQPEYLHLARHRDSNGNLIVAPAQPQKTHPQHEAAEATPSELTPSPEDPQSAPVSPSSLSEEMSQSASIQKTVVPSQPNSWTRQGTDWGMSVLDVKANETIPPVWEVRAPILEDFEHRVAYRTQIEGIDTTVAYGFYQDQLAGAKYVFESRHEDPVDFVQDFHAVQEWITGTYGPPTVVQEIWLDKLYQYDQSLRGQALMRGHLVMVAEWKTAESNIALVLNGGDDAVGMVAEFSSTHIQPPTPSGDDTQQQEPAVENPETVETEPKTPLSL